MCVSGPGDGGGSSWVGVRNGFWRSSFRAVAPNPRESRRTVVESGDRGEYVVSTESVETMICGATELEPPSPSAGVVWLGPSSSSSPRRPLLPPSSSSWWGEFGLLIKSYSHFNQKKKRALVSVLDVGSYNSARRRVLFVCVFFNCDFLKVPMRSIWRTVNYF